MLNRIATAAVLALSLSPVAQAESRDTGIGRVIAAQGNQALVAIRAELKDAVRQWIPALPVQPAPAKVRLAGAASAPAAVRCAS